MSALNAQTFAGARSATCRETSLEHIRGSTGVIIIQLFFFDTKVLEK
jgi:hypothetical protein